VVTTTQKKEFLVGTGIRPKQTKLNATGACPATSKRSSGEKGAMGEKKKVHEGLKMSK